MPRGRRLLGGMLVVAAAVAALAIFGLSSDNSANAGRPAPALPRERLAGPPATLSGLLAGAGGRAALIVFWASWCGPCTREAPDIERFAVSPAGRGRVVGVDWSDGLAGAQSFVRRYSWTFPNMRDAEGTVGNAYRLTGLPSTFVLDGRGRIAALLRGPQTEASLARALAAVERA
ncbi:MAG: alkyl hydroperoxide reductase/Thiol specific antioxidant/Mal allergen [Solirubrobacterales bacterium]|jgi:thiol-disulfide isomerase/thioredoxin|nr:alkyl hydroperoxide reductase/Thiol specific antioxidant/Mal allergen [Solirubrobacterales bacterium]